MKLYELAGAEGLRFSPYCWRARLALAHKGLSVERIGWHYTDKAAIAFSGQEKVPVLVDGETVVADSWRIALYLEERYGDRPALFDGPQAEALTRYFNLWCDSRLNTALLPALVNAVHRQAAPEDRDYFRRTREQRLGKSFDVLAHEEQIHRERAIALLAPVSSLLDEQAFISGQRPAYADHILMGTVQWVRLISGDDWLTSAASLHEWRSRMDGLYSQLHEHGG